MGLLDEAIREHLELKRRHGASPEDVARAEREALGPVVRERPPAVAPLETDADAPEVPTARDRPVATPEAEGVEDVSVVERDVSVPEFEPASRREAERTPGREPEDTTLGREPEDTAPSAETPRAEPADPAAAPSETAERLPSPEAEEPVPSPREPVEDLPSPEAGERLPSPEAEEPLDSPEPGERLPSPQAEEPLPSPAEAVEGLPSPEAADRLSSPEAEESLLSPPEPVERLPSPAAEEPLPSTGAEKPLPPTPEAGEPLPSLEADEPSQRAEADEDSWYPGPVEHLPSRDAAASSRSPHESAPPPRAEDAHPDQPTEVFDTSEIFAEDEPEPFRPAASVPPAEDAAPVPEPPDRAPQPPPPPEGQEGDDVLEETPEFLQETPEHDRLWFEQKPPRDFDFDG